MSIRLRSSRATRGRRAPALPPLVLVCAIGCGAAPPRATEPIAPEPDVAEPRRHGALPVVAVEMTVDGRTTFTVDPAGAVRFGDAPGLGHIDGGTIVDPEGHVVLRYDEDGTIWVQDEGGELARGGRVLGNGRVRTDAGVELWAGDDGVARALRDATVARLPATFGPLPDPEQRLLASVLVLVGFGDLGTSP